MNINVPVVGVWCDYEVTHSLTHVCGLKGAPVVLPCTFKFSWIGSFSSGGWYINKRIVMRHRYSDNNPTDCSLKIDKLSDKHPAVYRFWFSTTRRSWMTNDRSGVTLSVTDLRLTANRATATEGESVTLTCSTTCTLSYNPTFVWHRNGRQVTSTRTHKANRLLLHPVGSGDAGSYSCAVKGQEHLSSSVVSLNIRYAPKNILVSVTPSEIAEGDSVTLACSSDANPPTNNYTWYKRTGNESVQVGAGPNYTITNVTPEHSVRYYCRAENDIGHSYTDVTPLKVRYRPKNTSVSASASGELPEGSLVTLTCSSDANPPVHTYTWYMKTGDEFLVRGTGESISFNVTSDTSGLYFCEAKNEIASTKSIGVEITLVAEKSTLLRAEIILTVILTIIGLLIILGVVWLRIRWKTHHAEPGMKDDDEEDDASAVYANISTIATTAAESKSRYPPDDVQYASINFSASREGNIRQHRRPEVEEEEVEYASVKFSRPSAATQWVFYVLRTHSSSAITGLYSKSKSKSKCTLLSHAHTHTHTHEVCTDIHNK
ncbi:hypothetical protein ACEWY4_017780 [Coilia grayii]|uniref:Ig-like domain-containing protein n=1 Tax=Coilia grayii TaxID=363190 RepID=A0ABD1JKP1_9TELE